MHILPMFVRLTGLEPARRGTLDPKSSASTNSATGAFPLSLTVVFLSKRCKDTNSFSFHQKIPCKFYQRIDSLTKIVIGLLDLVVGGDAELDLLTVAVVGGTG